MPEATPHSTDDTASLAPSPAELAALRAKAAQAAAEAAAARFAAAEAALVAAEAAAAQAAAAQADEEQPAPPPAPATREPPGDGAAAAWADVVARGYSFTGDVLALGALVADGEPEPAAQVCLPLRMMNRHGLVAGATGTGKTKTLQVMAEGLSRAGVPVFVADIKGDLSGLAVPGEGSEALMARAAGVGQDWTASAFPVELYSLGGLGTGVPIRTTVTDLGPLLLAKVLGLNQTQESSLGLIFHWADGQGLDLLDLKDLRATITYLVSDEGKDKLKGIGGLSAATAGVILREIVGLQAQGADVFFGEPAFDTADLLRLAPDGRGVISALELPAVQDRPALFSTFLMWLLAELFQELPEIGDPEKPRLVFFFDEAHLLFTDASKDFLTQVTQTVRLIRSKGVGVFFVTQTPRDVPADVLAQLGNRVQHALRAFTPQDATALRATVRTFPTSPYDLEEVLTSLGIGEAVVTVLTEKGAPTPVAWTRLRAPESSMEPAPATALERVVAASPLWDRYGTAVDAESAYELLAARAAQQRAAADAAAQAEKEAAAARQAADDAARAARKQAAELERMGARLERDAGRRSSTRSRSRSTPQGSSPLDSLLRSAGSQLGREITRTIFGTRRR